MKTQEAFKPHVLTVLALTCIAFTPLSFIINFICGVSITISTMLQLWAGILIFALCFLISLIKMIIKKINYKKSAINYFSYLYTAIYFVLNIFVMAVDNTNIWNLFSLLILVPYSAIIAILMQYLRLNSFLLREIIYYALSVTSFLLLTSVIGDYNQGYMTMILFGTFTVVFSIGAFIYYLVKRSIEQAENDDKAYKPMFD